MPDLWRKAGICPDCAAVMVAGEGQSNVDPKPSRADHALRLKAQLRYLDEELRRIARTRESLERSMDAAISQQICLRQELDSIRPAKRPVGDCPE